MVESAPQLPEHDIEAAPQQPVQDDNPPADGNKSSSSDKDEGQTYEQRLYNYVNYIKNYPDSTGYLDFHDLAQMNILRLMNELAKYDQAMRKDKAAPQDIENVGNLLHRYTTAVQDLGYWSRLPKYDDVFHAKFIYEDLRQILPGVYGNQENLRMAHLSDLPQSTLLSVDPLRNFLRRVLPRHLTLDNKRGFKRLANGALLTIQTSGTVNPFVDTLARFIVAVTGGLSLVIPMLVMRLGETLPKSLTTVSVAVILFSALTSLMFKASNVETLAATAAYAAVLVVFVGTSS